MAIDLNSWQGTAVVVLLILYVGSKIIAAWRCK
jgi:hypothetical protein